jgi:hypothetical protein
MNDYQNVLAVLACSTMESAAVQPRFRIMIIVQLIINSNSNSKFYCH